MIYLSKWVWLVVWNMNFIFHFIDGMSSFPLPFIFFRGVETSLPDPQPRQPGSSFSQLYTGWTVGGLEYEFYDFPYIGNSNPSWLSYFSEGLQPPTSTSRQNGPQVGVCGGYPIHIPVENMCEVTIDNYVCSSVTINMWKAFFKPPFVDHFPETMGLSHGFPTSMFV